MNKCISLLLFGEMHKIMTVPLDTHRLVSHSKSTHALKQALNFHHPFLDLLFGLRNTLRLQG